MGSKENISENSKETKDLSTKNWNITENKANVKVPSLQFDCINNAKILPKLTDTPSIVPREIPTALIFTEMSMLQTPVESQWNNGGLLTGSAIKTYCECTVLQVGLSWCNDKCLGCVWII